MSFTDMEDLRKRRGVFEESSSVPDSSFNREASLPDEIDAFSPSSPKENLNGQQIESAKTSSQNEVLDHIKSVQESDGFDQESFESIICEKVAPDVMKRLREASGDNMERAVNMYFDGSWKTATAVPSRNNSNPRTLTINDFARSISSGERIKSPIAKVESRKPSLRDAMPDYRYVGLLG